MTGRAPFALMVLLLSACARTPRPPSQLGPTHSYRLGAVTGRADHVVAVSGAPVGAQGTTLGFAVAMSPRPWIEFYGRSAGGTLTAANDSRANHDLAEAEVGVSGLLLPWLAATVSAETRLYTGELATQRWAAIRAGAEARLELASGARGVIRASAFPKVSVDGLPSPNLAIGAGTGIELRRRRLFASLLYSIDRFDFPAGTGGTRVEQLSSLMLQAGWRFGR